MSECLQLQLQLSSIFWPASFIFLFVIDYNGLAGMGECEFERPFEGVEWSKLLSMEPFIKRPSLDLSLTCATSKTGSNESVYMLVTK